LKPQKNFLPPSFFFFLVNFIWKEKQGLLMSVAVDNTFPQRVPAHDTSGPTERIHTMPDIIELPAIVGQTATAAGQHTQTPLVRPAPATVSRNFELLLRTVWDSVLRLSQMHGSTRGSGVESAVQAIVTLLHSVIAATVLFTVLCCQFVSIIWSIDSLLVTASLGLENALDNASFQPRRMVATLLPAYVKSLMKMVWLVGAYQFKFTSVRPVYINLTVIRVILECVTFGLKHRESLREGHRLRRYVTIFFYFIGMALISIPYSAFFTHSKETFSVLEHSVILLVWLGEAVSALVSSCLMFTNSIPDNSLEESVLKCRIEIVLSICHSLFTCGMRYGGFIPGSYRFMFLLFHHIVPVIVSSCRLIQLHAIQWQLRTRFQQLSKEEVDALATDELCPICLHHHQHPTTLRLSCGHLAHSSCLVDMLKATNEPRCPMCRAAIPLFFSVHGVTPDANGGLGPAARNGARAISVLLQQGGRNLGDNSAGRLRSALLDLSSGRQTAAAAPDASFGDAVLITHYQQRVLGRGDFTRSLLRGSQPLAQRADQQSGDLSFSPASMVNILQAAANARPSSSSRSLPGVASLMTAAAANISSQPFSSSLTPVSSTALAPGLTLIRLSVGPTADTALRTASSSSSASGSPSCTCSSMTGATSVSSANQPQETTATTTAGVILDVEMTVEEYDESSAQQQPPPRRRSIRRPAAKRRLSEVEEISGRSRPTTTPRRIRKKRRL
jgi:hypothetical protein